MATNYILNWSDSTLKPSFTLYGGGVDTTTTSLTLTAKASINWGEPVLEDLIRIMEHGASNGLAPSNPTIGQLWFNAANNKLYLMTVANVWAPLDGSALITLAPTAAPTPAPTIRVTTPTPTIRVTTSAPATPAPTNATPAPTIATPAPTNATPAPTTPVTTPAVGPLIFQVTHTQAITSLTGITGLAFPTGYTVSLINTSSNDGVVVLSASNAATGDVIQATITTAQDPNIYSKASFTSATGVTITTF